MTGTPLMAEISQRRSARLVLPPARLRLRLQGTMPNSPAPSQQRWYRGQSLATLACAREGSLRPAAGPAFVGPADDRPPPLRPLLPSWGPGPACPSKFRVVA